MCCLECLVSNSKLGYQYDEYKWHDDKVGTKLDSVWIVFQPVIQKPDANGYAD